MEKTYRIPPQRWRQVWLRSLPINLAISVLVGFSVPLLYMLFWQTPSGYIASAIPKALLLTLLLLAVLTYFIRRQVRDLEKYEVVLGEDFVTRRMPTRSDLTIRFADITEIIDSPSLGIWIKTTNPSFNTVIPHGIQDEQELRDRLSRVKPVRAAPIASPLGRFAGIYSLLFFIALPIMFIGPLWAALPSILFVGGSAGRGLWLSLQKTSIPTKDHWISIANRSILLVGAIIALALRIIWVISSM